MVLNLPILPLKAVLNAFNLTIGTTIHPAISSIVKREFLHFGHAESFFRLRRFIKVKFLRLLHD